MILLLFILSLFRRLFLLFLRNFRANNRANFLRLLQIFLINFRLDGGNFLVNYLTRSRHYCRASWHESRMMVIRSQEVIIRCRRRRSERRM